MRCPMGVQLVAWIGLVGCGGKAVDSASPSDDTIDLPTSTCGGTYDWLGRSEVGSIVAYEPLPDFSIDQAAVQGLMAVAGATDTSEARFGVQVGRVRYTTQDRGVLTEATALVAWPDTTGPVDSLLYLHPATGLEDFCAPSGRDLIWAGVPIVLASMGYAVAAPDYLGQNGFGDEAAELHPYLTAEPTAVASLDALRALWALSPDDTSAGVTPGTRTLILGASQGGGAAFWAERYAQEYLPEANLIGTVSTVPLMDVYAWAVESAAALTVGSVGVPIMLETSAQWYGLDADISEVIPSSEVDRLYTAFETECPEAALPDDVTTLDDVYTTDWQTALAAGTAPEPWDCMLRENSPATAPVGRGAEVPAFVIIGGADDVALTSQSRATVDALCADGHPVVAVECNGLGHEDTVQATLDLTLDVLRLFEVGEQPEGEVCGTIQTMDCG